MIVRALTSTGDWTYGTGAQNYLQNAAAVAQCIQTGLKSFLGNCFFATNAGIDWFDFLSGKSQVLLNLAIATQILNTQNVTGIQMLIVNLDTLTRNITIEYSASTVYSLVSGVLSFNPTNL